jgi:tetratricopeptide (TPR) repeat protein
LPDRFTQHMTKPKPIPKKVIVPIQKKQGVQSKKLVRQEKGFFDHPWGLLIIILIITFIAFLPSLSGQFIRSWDDPVYVTENPLITHLNWESIKGFFTNQRNGTYVPFPLLSWALEFQLFGLNPFPYHLDNLLIHLLCTSLVFYFFILLRIPLMYAAFGALLFGIHPMRVESVAWVTERKDLLFCLFYLGSLIIYCKYIVSEKEKPKYLLLTLLLFVFSLFSKIQAVSLTLTIILLDYWFARPLKWKLVWEKIPFFVLSLGFGLSGYFILQHLQVIDIHDKYTLIERILMGLYSLSAYLFKLLLPLNLSIYYPYPVEPGEALPVLYYLNIVFLIVLAVLIFLTVRKTRAVVFGVLFFLFNVMFLLQIVRAGNAYQADRFTYVAYIGLFFLATWAAEKFTIRYRSRTMLIPVLAVVASLFFFLTTYARCKDWKDSITLWGDVISKYDKAKIAYYNRGIEYGYIEQWDMAITDFSKTIEIDPNYFKAYSNRGVSYKNIGQWDNAIADYSRAIEIDPKYATDFYNRGNAYRNIRQWDKSLSDYTRAIVIDPKFTEAYSNRGIVYGNIGQWDKAVTEYSKAIESDPKFSKAWSNRGIAYENLGKWEMAIVDLSKAIEMDPESIETYTNRAIAYGNLGKWDKAIADYSRAIEINPKYTDAYCNRGIAYGNLGQWEKAITDFSSAIQIDPNYTKAYYNRDLAYNKMRSQKKQ